MFDSLRGGIGSLILLWSRIERAVKKEILACCGEPLPKSVNGIKSALDRWRDIEEGKPETSDFHKIIISKLLTKLQYALDMRNGFCHGCVDISVGMDGQSGMITWTFKEENHKISYDELTSILGWLSKIPFLIQMISRPRVIKAGCRFVDTHENREWWRIEFGL